jgi:hypothetical protein
MSEPHVVTDYDECRVSEGLELGMQGRGFTPYPAVPGPPPRPESAGRPE